MSYSRLLCALVGAVSITACSGNLGGGQSTLPGAPQGNANVAGIAAPTPTASPVSASNIATIGDSVAPQALPAVMGWGGSIAFPNPSTAPSPSPNPKTTPGTIAALPASSVSIGVTAAVVEPADAPRFSSADSKDHRSSGKRADPKAMKGLLFISLLSTADVTLGEYPKIALDVPREIASKYRDDLFALALYDPETKAKTYRLAVAERDLSSPPPGSAAIPTPTPAPAPTMPPATAPSGMFNGPAPFTPPPIGTGLDATLPPEHVAFLGTAASLTLKANRPVVFAFYAVPPLPSPSPTTSATAAAGSPSPAASASPPAAAPSAPASTPVPPAPTSTPAKS